MIQVPERFYETFDSKFPSLGTLNDPALKGSLLFAQAGLKNIVKYTAAESALRIQAIGIPSNLAPGAVGLFAGFDSYIAGIANMGDDLSVPEALIEVGDGFAAMASSMGAFSSVPIVGVIIEFALQIAEMAVGMYSFKHNEDIEALSWGYDRDTDEDIVREMLDVHRGEDLTGLFLPVNDASAGIEILNTEIREGPKDKVLAALYIPRGPGTSHMGGLPNTQEVVRGSEMNTNWNPRTRPFSVPWSHFKPATAQASLGSWQSILSNSRACYLVDAKRVAAAWNAWQDNMVNWGWGTRYKGDDRIRMSMLSRPPVPYDVQQKIGQDGYRRLVPFWPGSGMSKSGGTAGSKPYYGPLLGDVAAWAADRQLGRRQTEYLGTLTVAYCSERDPAFESDPLLADLLLERRQLLLQHPAVELVELDQVVDQDYRQAVATRQGPGGLVDAPKGPPSGPGSIAGSIPKEQRLPPVFTLPPAKAAPFLGGSEGRSFNRSGDSLKNAAVLALLGFLVR